MSLASRMLGKSKRGPVDYGRYLWRGSRQASPSKTLPLARVPMGVGRMAVLWSHYGRPPARPPLRLPPATIMARSASPLTYG